MIYHTIKVHCLGCGNLILKTTAEKYQGYSRQCQQKQLLAMQNTEPILTHADIMFYLEKTFIQMPKIYTEKEYAYIYAIPYYQSKQYHKKYLINVFKPLFQSLK